MGVLGWMGRHVTAAARRKLPKSCLSRRYAGADGRIDFRHMLDGFDAQCLYLVHGAAMAIGDRGYVLTAAAGTGKSRSLRAALAAAPDRSAEAIDDGFVYIMKVDGRWWVVESQTYPFVALTARYSAWVRGKLGLLGGRHHHLAPGPRRTLLLAFYGAEYHFTRAVAMLRMPDLGDVCRDQRMYPLHRIAYMSEIEDDFGVWHLERGGGERRIPTKVFIESASAAIDCVPLAEFEVRSYFLEVCTAEYNA